MEVVDELFHYIHKIPEEHFLEISQYVLLPAVGGEALQPVKENNNNVQSERRYSEYEEKENCTQASKTTKENDTEEIFSENYTVMTRAKRGRPPSKPPTREVVKRRRKVGYLLCLIIMIQGNLEILYKICSIV